MQAAAEDAPDIGYSVKSNADRLAALDLLRTGGETVEVSFINKSGDEQTVTLKELGKMQSFRDARIAFSHSLEEGEDVNFSTRMLNDKCGYLRLIVNEKINCVMTSKVV